MQFIGRGEQGLDPKMALTDKDRLTKMASLRTTLIGLENTHLSGMTKPQERDVYYAAVLLADGKTDQDILSEDMRATSLCAHLSQPTYNRALKQLVADGYLSRSPSAFGRYRLAPIASKGGVSCNSPQDMNGKAFDAPTASH